MVSLCHLRVDIVNKCRACDLLRLDRLREVPLQVPGRRNKEDGRRILPGLHELRRMREDLPLQGNQEELQRRLLRG